MVIGTYNHLDHLAKWHRWHKFRYCYAIGAHGFLITSFRFMFIWISVRYGAVTVDKWTVCNEINDGRNCSFMQYLGKE